MKNLVEIYDTTLRDGRRAKGLVFRSQTNCAWRETRRWCTTWRAVGGVIPRILSSSRKQPNVNGETPDCRLRFHRRKKVAAKDDQQVKLLIDAETSVVTIFGKTWLLHVQEVLRTTPKENIAMIADTIAFLKKNKRKVIYDAEHALDGYKDDPEYALATWKAAEEAGADFVVLCDTNGGTLPSEVAEITAIAGTFVSGGDTPTTILV